MADFEKWHDTIEPVRDFPGEGNPALVCDGIPELSRRCGRIQSADMYVFYRGRYVCDACAGLLRRKGGPHLSDEDTRPSNFAGRRNMPRRLTDLKPRELANIYGRKPRPRIPRQNRGRRG